jgi:peptidoglycan/LPS O-acetylase OafA/YrhL
MVDLGGNPGLPCVFPDVALCTKSALLNLVVVLVGLNISGQVFSCLAFFYAGGLAAIARRAIASVTFSGVIESVGWSAVAIVPILIWMFRSQFQVIDWVFFLTCTPIFLFCLSCKITVPAPAQRLLEAAGNMTYSSYLAHFPIQLLIALGFSMSGSPIPFYNAWFFAMFVASTLLTSYLAYRHFEAPAQTLLRNYLLPDPAPAARANATASTTARV